MKKPRFFALGIVLLSALSLTACGWAPEDYAGNFEYRLQGTWEINASVYYPYISSLEFTSNTITIIGLDWYENNPSIPFSDFTKNVPLKGYSEKTNDNNGIIYIEEFGVLHEGIPYQYESRPMNESPETLRFSFPSLDEPNIIVNLLKVAN